MSIKFPAEYPKFCLISKIAKHHNTLHLNYYCSPTYGVDCPIFRFFWLPNDYIKSLTIPLTKWLDSMQRIGSSFAHTETADTKPFHRELELMERHFTKSQKDVAGFFVVHVQIYFLMTNGGWKRKIANQRWTERPWKQKSITKRLCF